MLRISFGAALLVLVLAGCGGGAPQDAANRGLPRTLARAWEGRASAIATAAAAGNDCEARRLAASLRNDVVGSRSKVPSRLRSALLSGVYALADRTTCTRVVTVPAHPSPPPKGPPKPKPPHQPPGHDHGHGKPGDGNDQ